MKGRSYLVAIIAVAVLVPLQARAGCAAKLAEIDQRIGATELDTNLRNAIQQFRNQAASICERGHDVSAMQTLQIVEMMLPPPQVKVDDPAIAAEPSGALDWPAIRREAGLRYPNRWDDLTLMDDCHWLTARELESELGLLVSLEFRRTDYLCEYRFQPPKGRPVRVFELYVEVHEDTASARKAESNLIEGFAGQTLFSPFDPGVSDMNVYVSVNGKYLYVFPEDGITLWRLGYMKDAPDGTTFFKPTPDDSGTHDIGTQFIALLVNKYKGQL